MFVQIIIKLTAAVRELSCQQRKKLSPKQYSHVATERTVKIQQISKLWN